MDVEVERVMVLVVVVAVDVVIEGCAFGNDEVLWL